MTDDERDELIEQSLLKKLNETEEARVQQLRRDDILFREEYDFQEKLIQQVQLRRRQELLTMFGDFEAEQIASVAQERTEPTNLFPGRVDQEATQTDPKIIPLGQKNWLWLAASVLLALTLGTIIWWSQYDPKPIADDSQDSTNVQPPKDTLRSRSVDAPRVQQQAPLGPVAQKPERIRQLHGAEKLPYYETDDVSLGFGKNGQAKEYRTVLFKTAPEPTYTFDDTLTVYLPVLPPAKPAWSLVYSRAEDTYYLTVGKTRYEIVRGLQGRQPLKKIN